MPNKNGTGPEGKGPKTGRGMGACGDGTPRGGGRGLGRGQGRGTGLGLKQNTSKDGAEEIQNN